MRRTGVWVLNQLEWVALFASQYVENCVDVLVLGIGVATSEHKLHHLVVDP